MLFQLIVDGLALGAIYALVALGFVVIYRASQVFNFAQGEFLAFGAFSMWALGEAGVPWGLALVLSVLSTGVLAASVERVFLRPLVGRPIFVTIIVTIFVGAILHTLMIAVWGPEEKGMTPTPWKPDATVSLKAGRVEGGTNVNEATEFELIQNLGIPAASAKLILKRRAIKAFTNPSELSEPFGQGTINVLRASEEELASGLSISKEQAKTITALRARGTLSTLSDLEPVLGSVQYRALRPNMALDGPTTFIQIPALLSKDQLTKLAAYLRVSGPTDYQVISPVEVNLGAVVAIFLTLLVLAVFFWLMKKTRMGVAMRATSVDQEAALSLGIPVGRIFGFSWFLAGMLAGMGGIFLGMYPNVVEINLAYVAMVAFPAAVIGGLESGLGAVIAGFMLGVLEQLASYYIEPALGDFGPGFARVFPYVIMIAFLVVRPYGLFGKREVERI